MRVYLNKQLIIILTFAVCIFLGILFGRLSIDYWSKIKQVIVPVQTLYSTSNKILKSRYNEEKISDLNWASMLPKQEYEVIARYQESTPKNLEQMTASVLRSIKASTDQNYQDALISTNTVKWFENKMVNISGFIVPIDFYQNKSVKSFFLVPYFGACTHLPAPPPNQMIFVQLESGFKDVDITQSYTLAGEIRLGLYEDHMGTSAYTLNVVSIVPFYGQSKDFRTH